MESLEPCGSQLLGYLRGKAVSRNDYSVHVLALPGDEIPILDTLLDWIGNYWPGRGGKCTYGAPSFTPHFFTSECRVGNLLTLTQQ